MSNELMGGSLVEKTQVIVIGAGAAGISATLELADQGYLVHLFEKNTLGSGSSGRNPGRMGHGFHYVDVETAKMYLRASIQVQRKYPNYLVGKELPWEHPLRHGRYLITKNSDHPKEKILHTYAEIQKEYGRLVNEDPKNEVFGSPDKFFRILEPREYENQLNTSIVDVGIETAEHLFSWKDFSEDIKRKIESHPNIVLHENTEVINISQGEKNNPRFTLDTKKMDSTVIKTFTTDYLINSTWENIEYLNKKIGIPMVPHSRTNRLKTLLTVKLPESLKDCNSLFFCMGKHCMMSNMGNGTAKLTFADVTNMEVSDKIKMSEKAYRLLNGGATEIEKFTIAKQMIEGIANYIPGIANAVVLDVEFGIVQTEGKLTLDDLSNPNSSVHQRCYDGIREEKIGVISNPCMKLFYFVRNGEVVTEILNNQVKATRIIHVCMQAIQQYAKCEHFFLSSEMEKNILKSLERHKALELLNSTVEQIIEPIIQQIKIENQVIQKKHSFFKPITNAEHPDLLKEPQYQKIALINILTILIDNIKQKKEGRFTCFTWGSENKIKKLQAVLTSLEDNKSLSGTWETIRDICATKRNYFGFHEPHSLKEFMRLHSNYQLEVESLLLTKKNTHPNDPSTDVENCFSSKK